MTLHEFLSLPVTHINAIINRFGETCYDNGIDDYMEQFEFKKHWPLFDDFIANINKDDLQI